VFCELICSISKSTLFWENEKYEHWGDYSSGNLPRTYDKITGIQSKAAAIIGHDTYFAELRRALSVRYGTAHDAFG
jgi:hypothetical protein